jgi:hypothetical protein
VIPRSSIRRALAVSAVLHAVGAAAAWWAIGPTRVGETALVDIEIAPLAPRPEALPPELPTVPRPLQPDLAAKQPPEPDSTPSHEPGEAPVDAGIDAPPDAARDAVRDAAIDARPDARRKRDAAVDAAIDAVPDAATDAAPDAVPDAGIDADEAVAAGPDAGAIDDAGAPPVVADHHAAAPDPAASPPAGSNSAPAAPEVAATGSGTGSAAGSGSSAIATARPGTGSAGPLDTAALAAALAAGSAAGEPSADTAVDGAPTTAGTAANLLSYFPDGHVVTALIRFDRLRGTEWAAQTEQLLRPLPDYRGLFGARDARLADKLETLVISTPRPRDAAATTLVARTQLSRAALRELLATAAPVTWSVATGGLVGKRSASAATGDRRVVLSPFKSWFVLAQPGDLGGLTAAAKGNPDTVEATAALPPWLAQIRTIEGETGDPRGPAVVVTVGLRGKRLALGSFDFGLGISSIATPDRASLAMELVPQGWLVRGNLRFLSEADAIELVAAVQQVQQRIAGSYVLQLAVGKRLAHVIASLAFARNGVRVSYATSMSIADARAILAAAGKHIEQYFGHAP